LKSLHDRAAEPPAAMPAIDAGALNPSRRRT